MSANQLRQLAPSGPASSPSPYAAKNSCSRSVRAALKALTSSSLMMDASSLRLAPS
jgi:hypothetical protein